MKPILRLFLLKRAKIAVVVKPLQPTYELVQSLGSDPDLGGGIVGNILGMKKSFVRGRDVLHRPIFFLLPPRTANVAQRLPILATLSIHSPIHDPGEDRTAA